MAEKKTKPDPAADPERSPKCAIIARVEGFRRGGIAHTVAPTVHEAGAFSLEQFEALQAEPNLLVYDADNPPKE